MRDERGFALLAALWLLVVLSVVGLELSLHTRDARRTAANAGDYTRARAAAEAGLEHARARLARLLREHGPDAGRIDPRSALDPWAAERNQLPDSVLMGAARYSVHLREVGTALNLNRATEEELFRLLLALSVDAGRAEQVAQSAMDWRDADDFRRARGAERDDYLRAGSERLPRNAPFEEVGELRYVRGVTPELFALVSPYLTVLGSGRVNLNSANRPVLLALPGMSEEAVAVVMRTRSEGRPIGNLFELSNELSSEARSLLVADLPRLVARTTTEVRELEVRSVGWTGDGPVRVQAEALIARGGENAFQVWRRIR
jgi:general secretion pathway protein K